MLLKAFRQICCMKQILRIQKFSALVLEVNFMVDDNCLLLV